MTEQFRDWDPGRPVPIARIWAPHRRGAGDPSYRVDPAGNHWRGVVTPLGPGTLRVGQTAGGPVRATAWGPGAEWLLDRLPQWLGAEDRPEEFVARHPLLADAVRRHPHWRIGASGLVFGALLPAILEQKVTGQEAFGSWRALVRRTGSRAPGPGADLDLWVPPSAAQVAAIPSWEWLALHVDSARSRAAVLAATRADSLQRGVDRAADLREAAGWLDRALRSLPGIGVWTSAETRSRAVGDPDALSVGDYHVAQDICWALTGTPADDARMLELLRPWEGQRYRVQALLAIQGHHRPRRGARMAPRTHLPAPTPGRRRPGPRRS